MAIKQILSTSIVVTGMVFASSFVPTQAQQSCFLQGANGQNIDLGHLCGGGGSSKPSVSPQTGVFTVPIKRRHSGIPVVDVTFNGQHTFEMLFDTGASGITISTDMADAMGLKPQAGAFSQTAGGVVPIGLSTVSSVKAGELSSSNLQVAINPSLPIGLLGQNFYGHYDVVIKETTIELRTR
ncbi:TIGR02281 family clan AA aspartic protease [Cyanothece sp. BG0011]|uniref:retropepsin-like aspartic protease family protein n=1 Tax=Cyanothece sp. BG0011 TaxID=2082950 RepID=UPI000D1FCD0B|nr:retropepsin-like aspartic protease [Cyanothece sp. BG0011]